MILSKTGNSTAKTFIGPIALIIALVALFIFIIKHCTPPENSITVLDPVKVPIAISFVDANQFLETQIRHVRITLIDPDQKVLTSNGLKFTQMDLEDGLVSLGLSQDVAIDQAKPYRFFLKVESPGYSTTYKSILVSDEKPYYVPVFMAKVTDPPKSMAGFDGSFAIKTSESIADQILIPNHQNQLNEQIVVQVPKGTLFYHGQCLVDPQSDSVHYQFTYGSPMNLAAARTLPCGPLVTDAFSNTGPPAVPFRPLYFSAAAWMNVEMSVNQENIDHFSEPVTLKIPISDSLQNPQTLQHYKVDDKIEAWSLDHSGVWRQDSVVKIQSDNSGLYAKVEVKHLSTWALGFMVSFCSSEVHVYYKYAGNTPLSFYTELVNAEGGNTLANSVLNYNYGKDTIILTKVPSGKKVELRVYNNTTAPTNTPPMALSGIFGPCSDAHDTMELHTAAVVKSLDMAFAVRSGTKDYPVCNNSLWYKHCITCGQPTKCDDIQSGSYHFGGNISRPVSTNIGNITLRQMFYGPDTIGFKGKYCFLLYYAGFDGTDVVSQSVKFIMDFNQTYERDIIGDNNVLIHYSLDPATQTHHFTVTQGITKFITSCEPPSPQPVNKQ